MIPRLAQTVSSLLSYDSSNVAGDEPAGMKRPPPYIYMYGQSGNIIQGDP
jgi:hypothetical protein